MSELERLLDQADADLMDAIYQRISIDVEHFRRTLRTAGRPFVDEHERPSPETLRETGEWVAAQSAFRAGAFGSAVSLTGAASVPIEIAGRSLSTLRLAQRLLVVYGLHPGSTRGRPVLWRVVAAAVDTPLPERGTVGLRATDLRRVTRQDDPNVAIRLTRGVLRRAVKNTVPHVLRWIPGGGLFTHGGRTRAKAHEAAARMLDTLDRLAEPAFVAPSADALELKR